MFLNPTTFSLYLQNFKSWKELFKNVHLLFSDKNCSNMIELKSVKYLGSGSSGEVVEYRSDFGSYAVKFFYSNNFHQFELEVAGYKKIEGKIPLVSYNQQNMVLVLDPVSSDSFCEQKIFNLELFLDLVNNLRMMKELGIMHRDIRPENLMYIPYGGRKRLVIIDWSCSIISTKAVFYQGTVHYASDRVLFELFKKQKKISFYTSDDLSSLVKIFLATITGFDQILKKVTGEDFNSIMKVWMDLYNEKPWTFDLIEAV
jgi:serine/threonine protein kinase